jgi:arabinan endo-1,5-alpha-L-arabinosidase
MRVIMLRKILLRAAATIVLPAMVMPALALDGEIAIHDPSTVIKSGDRYYTYGTVNGLPLLSSEAGWTWKRAGSLMSAVPGGKAGAAVLAKGGSNTWAPDVIHIGDKYFVYYSAPATQPRAAIGLLVCLPAMNGLAIYLRNRFEQRW